MISSAMFGAQVPGADVAQPTIGDDQAPDRPAMEQVELLSLPLDVVGQGRPPLILLSGMLGDASLWDAVAENLLDFVPLRTSRVDLASSITELADLVLAEAPPRFALAGHSLGAVVALEVLRRAPDRVVRLAVINASARLPSEEQRSHWAGLVHRVELGQFAAVSEELALGALPVFRRDDLHLLRASQRMAVNVGAAALVRQLSAQLSRGDYLSWLPAVTVPTLIVSGELDEVSPLALQREMAEAIPGAQHVVLADTGHMSPLENPSELSAALESWLWS
jgi:pimeloyl-ACP methyl ester carboxylesterase